MQLTKHCYAVTGLAHSTAFSVNAGFVVGDGETLVVDSGYNSLSAQTILGYAQVASQQRDGPLFLVNTEIHWDHILGNHIFKQNGARIIAHNRNAFENDPGLPNIDELGEWMTEEIAASFRARGENKEGFVFFDDVVPCPPDTYIDEDTAMEVGGLEVRLLLTRGHTDTNLSVFVPAERVIYVGDLIYSQYLPTPRFGNPTLGKEWIDSLEKLRQLDVEILVPGHGPICRGDEIQHEIERHKQLIQNVIDGKKPWWRL